MVKLAAFLEVSGCCADGRSRAWTGKFLLSGAMRAPPYTHPPEAVTVRFCRFSRPGPPKPRQAPSEVVSAQQQGVDGKADGLHLFPALHSQSSHG